MISLDLRSHAQSGIRRCVRCRDRQAINQSLLCGRHYSSLWTCLSDIELLYPLLNFVIEPGSTKTEELIRYSKQPDPAAPIRLEVALLRDNRTKYDPKNPDAVSIYGIANTWAELVREQRQLSATPNSTVLAEIGLLIRHLSWIANQPWIRDFDRDLRIAANAIRHACGEFDHRTPVGKCAVIYNETECDGPLYPDMSWTGVHCARCGETWNDLDLERLGLTLNQNTLEPTPPIRLVGGAHANTGDTDTEN